MRPEPLEVRIVEALAQAVEASPELPPHQTVLFKRPRAVLPDNCPLLCLFLVQKVYTAETVVYYDDAIAIGITWQEESVTAAETLIDDPESAKSQLRAMSAIEEVIMGLSIDGLAVTQGEMEDGSGRESDAVYAVYPVGIDLSEAPQTEEGLVEGYAMTVEVDATQTKRR